MTARFANPLDSVDHRIGLLTIISSSAAINILSLALPIVTLQVYDRVLHSGNTGTLHVLLFGAIVALAIETFLRISRAYVLTRRGATYVHGVSCAAINHQLGLGSISSQNKSVASSLSDLTAIKSLRSIAGGSTVVIWIDLLFLPLYIGVMAYISESLVLVPLSLLCAFALVIAFNGLSVRQSIDQAKQDDEQRYDFLLDSLKSTNELKALAWDLRLQRRFERFHEQSCRSHYKLSSKITHTFVYGTVLSHLMTAATVAVGGYLAVHGSLTVGGLIAVVLLSNRLMLPVQKGVLLWLQYQDLQSSKQRVSRLFEGEIQSVDKDAPAPLNGGRIDAARLTYRPDTNAPLLLDGVDLSVERGETLALDGPAGSGKTVLLKLLAGILQPTSGTVRVNGTDPALMPPTTRAQQIGYMSAESKLFRGTIRDNITRFSQVSSEQALEVASLLNLTDELSRLPLGIDTIVGGDNDSTLTPGVARMICLLRVLSAKPRIILFDEADTGLDAEHYKALLNLLARLKPLVAMIIVSRDCNISSMSDRSVFLNDGRLIETSSSVQRFLPIETRI